MSLVLLVYITVVALYLAVLVAVFYLIVQFDRFSRLCVALSRGDDCCGDAQESLSH